MTETVGHREDGVGGEARAVLVGAGEPRHIEELGRLATTLGMEGVGTLERGRGGHAGYLGRGKREELGGLVEEVGAGFVVTDDELTASQARVLERAAGAVVVDRTELIIRIFEVHAGDAASSLEVERADLQYRLPRVKGRNPELSRLGGGRGGAGRGARRGGGARAGGGRGARRARPRARPPGAQAPPPRARRPGRRRRRFWGRRRARERRAAARVRPPRHPGAERHHQPQAPPREGRQGGGRGPGRAG